jgi:hypothetical protein
MNSSIYEVSVKFTDLGEIWTKVDMQPPTMLEVLKTGLYLNKPVTAIILDTFTAPDSQVIYSITAAKQGGQPWSLK